MQELPFIERLAKIHHSSPFLADAEILPECDGFALYSMDSFSEHEDFLGQLAPRQIGYQMACAACSDILACGTLPTQLLQTWNCDSAHEPGFYLEVAAGIQDVLTHYGATCIGGDIGTATEWIWTATVIGHTHHPVRRTTSRRKAFALYASGPMGLANAAVFCKQPLPLFPLRNPVPENAMFATDTSGGLLDAIENFRRVNHGLQLELDADAAISPKVREILPSDVPPEWTLVGGIGEYELVFALPAGIACPEGIRIGTGYFRDDSNENVVRIHCGGKCGTMKTPPPDYRDVPDADWLPVTANYWNSLFE